MALKASDPGLETMQLVRGEVGRSCQRTNCGLVGAGSAPEYPRVPDLWKESERP